MKKLESLNNSLFDKFENNKVNNLAMCLSGGAIINTQSQQSSKGDTFLTNGDDNTNANSTMYLGGQEIHGDYKMNSSVGGAGAGGGGGSSNGGGGNGG